ncbi:ATP-binding cassette domain-containing protein [Enterococcus termitis]
MYTLTQETPAVEFSVQGKQADDFKDAALKNVSFSYGAEQKKVLTDLTLEIDKGVIIGIGGESGNGKSTLLKLLMRYWDPQTGQILLNQSELKEFQEASLHQIEGVMEQSTFIFEDTIINNIGIGKQDASLQEIEIAAKKAALHEWIVSLSEKYETKIGGNHRSVSDGERQRIGLARLFLHDAPLLLLDEPTSNLDYLNEQAVLASLVKGINGKTVLLISHRDTTLEIADQRYELFNGSLLQRKSKQ